MSRTVTIALLSIALCALALYGLLSTPWLLSQTRAGTCESYLAQPTLGWLSLGDCVLDMEQVMLESESGAFEPLAGRREGLWRTLPDSQVRWVVAWAPVKEARGSRQVVRAVYRLDGADLMHWLNDFDAASPAQKERLWADPVPLRRLVRPARVEAHAAKPEDGLKSAYGPLASANLVVLTPGRLPRPPWGSLAAGSLGVLLLGFIFLKLARAKSGDDTLLEHGVKQVKVEIGELEQLRREERAARRSGRSGPES